ncbi:MULTISPECIES: hypothetical protein [unclassified Solwaraspora]|uniref:hypothetical protein n=1 Tax=unclassified Solwaraspora TaxID=2627926 RepID=UPI00259B3A10|nr:hypothetical protein [Solwaraspora sp. WMMA2056]WJK39367.1 hypothetical protein O7608_23305 [Solwaraspora sp. WMMA2056]
MWWVVGVSVAVVLASAYLTWTAARVDRLHVRVAAAARALDAHLLRRAAAAAVLAEEKYGVELYAAARIALDAASPEEREAAENDLTRQLRATALVGDDPATEAVVVASRRLVLARQLHTDLVRDALLARRRPLVRLLRFGRRHDEPRYFDIDDPTLTRDPDLSSSPAVRGGGDTAVR